MTVITHETIAKLQAELDNVAAFDEKAKADYADACKMMEVTRVASYEASQKRAALATKMVDTLDAYKVQMQKDHRVGDRIINNTVTAIRADTVHGIAKADNIWTGMPAHN